MKEPVRLLLKALKMIGIGVAIVCVLTPVLYFPISNWHEKALISYWKGVTAEAVNAKEPLPHFLAREKDQIDWQYQNQKDTLPASIDARDWVSIYPRDFLHDDFFAGSCDVGVRVDSHNRIIDAFVKRYYSAF